MRWSYGTTDNAKTQEIWGSVSKNNSSEWCHPRSKEKIFFLWWNQKTLCTSIFRKKCRFFLFSNQYHFEMCIFVLFLVKKKKVACVVQANISEIYEKHEAKTCFLHSILFKKILAVDFSFLKRNIWSGIFFTQTVKLINYYFIYIMQSSLPTTIYVQNLSFLVTQISTSHNFFLFGRFTWYIWGI